jgi:hypothetical protein
MGKKEYTGKHTKKTIVFRVQVHYRWFLCTVRFKKMRERHRQNAIIFFYLYIKYS